MVTRSTLPGPNPQCDRVAHCVSNVASTLRLAASSLDEIHDILRGQPPLVPTMSYPPVLQPLGVPPRPPAPLHFSGNLRPIAAPSQLGASTSDDDSSFPDASHVPRIPSSLDDSDCSSAPAPPPPTKRPRTSRPAKAKAKSRLSTPPSASTRRRLQLCQDLLDDWDSWEPWQEELHEDQCQATPQLELHCQEAPTHTCSMQGDSGHQHDEPAPSSPATSPRASHSAADQHHADEAPPDPAILLPAQPAQVDPSR